jgi:hypothetical protein
MNTPVNTKWMTYRELELIPDTVPEPIPSRWVQLRTRLCEAWNGLLIGLTQHPEPYIWQENDGTTGILWWHIYDPVTGDTLYMESADEVLAWLEKRPYV